MATPDLPDDPTVEQIAARVGLAELVGVEDFRARMRRAAVRQAAGSALDVECAAGGELMEFTRQKVAEATESGIAPLSEEGAADEPHAAWTACTSRGSPRPNPWRRQPP
ncbi:hypothetical protein [Streptomyces sp. NPDC050528]|uniref:hypothetical protein n=1 Tax=Streptomyces sp. NPDC050528 TaxID=3365623 RepID=UPI0037A7AD0D